MKSNTPSEFESLFKKATGKEPYPYQVRLATGFEEDLPSVISIPTGIGKTSGAVMAWIWRRKFHPDEKVRESTPRRLVYCLPMRVLVEQTMNNIIRWLYNLGILGGSMSDQNGSIIYNADFSDVSKIPVVVLMGGEQRTKWDIYPERDMIIIGTQDMLLSREINRGYAMSKYRWPVHFALLNNDSLWILDEVQLMGSGLLTSIQLEKFRRQRGTIGITKSIWMSATLEPEMLKTVDFDPQKEIKDTELLSLSDDDLKTPGIIKLLNSKKKVNKLAVEPNEFKKIAKTILDKHTAGTTTITIMNNVKGAQKLFKEVRRLSKNVDIVLLHSQFRSKDREEIVKKVLGNPQGKDLIIISTQVIEAGVDISSKTLFTEVAPWVSMVQRFGRCNRYGESDEANIYWLDYGEKNAPKQSGPYNQEDVLIARQQLLGMEGKNASPLSLPKLNYLTTVDERDVLRYRDLFELFDNTSDILGESIDVSRFVRDSKDSHVYVFWRIIFSSGPVSDEPLPDRSELCPSPIGEIRKVIADGEEAWTWDYYNGQWELVEDPVKIVPGMEIMLKTSSGHYSPEIGWDIGYKGNVEAVNIVNERGESYDDISSSYLSQNTWKTISEHTDEVVEKAKVICNSVKLESAYLKAVTDAARWHDYGKAHQEFQAKIKRDDVHNQDYLAAKAPSNSWIGKAGRRHFRHELVSGLVTLKTLEMYNNENAFLVAYLAASHHGKIRMSIRSLPDEDLPNDDGMKFARGVWDGEKIPRVDLGGGTVVPDTRVDLSPMVMGEGSWISRAISLCEDPTIGVFRLAYLEAIVRAADERASGGV